jgi:predicted TIM-barrel enzyme
MKEKTDTESVAITVVAGFSRSALNLSLPRETLRRTSASEVVREAILHGSGDAVARSTLRELSEVDLDFDVEVPGAALETRRVADIPGALADAIGRADSAVVIASPEAAGANADTRYP